ncbi:hypothetical protein KL925_003386 [Ogataea polymorpha]|nr:hypothetical protein KL925_003386 [Ogataea polymorpha]
MKKSSPNRTPKFHVRRAALACSQCRRSKTRCHYLNNGQTCFRCTNLGIRCSLADVNLTDSLISQNAISSTENASISQKLDEVLSKVDLLLGVRRAAEMVDQELDNQPEASNLLDKLYFDVTPFRDVRRAGDMTQIPFSKELAHGIWPLVLAHPADADVVASGLLSESLANELVRLAIDFYGLWGGIYAAPHNYVNELRTQCPLLLAVLCLLGLRFYRGLLPQNMDALARSLLQTIQRLLSASILVVPQTKYQIQAFLLIALFSISLSYQAFYFDGWFLSGYALLHYITREMDLNLLSDRFKMHPDRIESFRLWNQLALTHLCYCLLSGRPCLIDTLRLDQCRNILDIPSASSFDGRIVSQLSILLTLYNALQFKEPLETSLKDLKSSFNDWKHLLEQDTVGPVIVITYRFSKVMLYRRAYLTTLDPKLIQDLDTECEKLIDIFKDTDIMLLVKSSDLLKFFMMFAALNLAQHGKNGPVLATAEICRAFEYKIVYYNQFASIYRRLLESVVRSYAQP